MHHSIPRGVHHAGTNSRRHSRPAMPPLPGSNRPALRLARHERRILLLPPPGQDQLPQKPARPHRPRDHPHGNPGHRGPRQHLRRPRRRPPPPRREHHRHPPRRPDDLRPPGRHAGPPTRTRSRPPGPNHARSQSRRRILNHHLRHRHPRGCPTSNQQPATNNLAVRPCNHPHQQGESPLLPPLAPLRQLQRRTIPRLRTHRAP
jgi:hypothetical protein